MNINLKRVYEAPAPEDGLRVLVERLWPRGLSKKDAGVDLWVRDLAPSTALRKWYAHEPEKWPGFQKRYREELDGNGPAVEAFKQRIAEGPVTFVYAARDRERNSAVTLKAYLERKGPGRP